MELSNAQKQAAINAIVSREMAVDANPALESMKGVDCCGFSGESGLVQVSQSAVETHTRGATSIKVHQETVITDFRV